MKLPIHDDITPLVVDTDLIQAADELMAKLQKGFPEAEFHASSSSEAAADSKSNTKKKTRGDAVSKPETQPKPKKTPRKKRALRKQRSNSCSSRLNRNRQSSPEKSPEREPTKEKAKSSKKGKRALRRTSSCSDIPSSSGRGHNKNRGALDKFGQGSPLFDLIQESKIQGDPPVIECSDDEDEEVADAFTKSGKKNQKVLGQPDSFGTGSPLFDLIQEVSS